MQRAIIKKARAQLDAELSQLYKRLEDPQQGLTNDVKSVKEQIRVRSALRDNADKTLQRLEDKLEELELQEQTLCFSDRIYVNKFQDRLAQPLRDWGLLDRGQTSDSAGTRAQATRTQFEHIPQQSDTLKDDREYEYFNNDPSASELLKRSIRQDLEDIEALLQNAKETFERLDDDLKRDKAAFLEKLATDEQQKDIVDFDIFQFRRKGEVTRELINAEAEYEEARQRARKVGICHFFDAESCFQDLSSDGYPEWMDTQMKHGVDHKLVDAWLSGTGNLGDDTGDTMPEVDEWDTEPVEICDSISVRAEGRLRLKIDAWSKRIAG